MVILNPQIICRCELGLVEVPANRMQTQAIPEKICASFQKSRFSPLFVVLVNLTYLGRTDTIDISTALG